MNYRRLINETIVATNGEMSRGLKNQLTIVSAFIDNEFEEKLDYLKKVGIPVHSYMGLRILEFKLSDINEVITVNSNKMNIYKTNPQELVRDLRKNEIKNGNLGYNEVGGM